MKNETNNNRQNSNKGMTEVAPGHWVANGKTLVAYLRRKAGRK